MPSLKLLERQIEADRAAVRTNYRRLRNTIDRRVGSPAGLASGFAAGFAGGWLTKSRRNRRREREQAQPEEEQVEVRTKPGKFDRLRSLVVVTMPLWQKLLFNPTPAPTAAQHAEAVDPPTP